MTDLEKVQQDGYALQFVKNQTLEICLSAVQQNSCALKYVENQTPEICLAAIEQDENALEYISLDLIKETFRSLIRTEPVSINIEFYYRFKILDILI